MPKQTTPKQLAANRRNAMKSTGPKTAAGKAVASRNARKHGILSNEVLVRGWNHQESSREYGKLHQRFREELQPAGPMEEMLVDQIVTCHWRLRRALKAESSEIALEVGRQDMNRQMGFKTAMRWLQWRASDNPIALMHDSWSGICELENWLKQVRESVEREGELTEAATRIPMNGQPNGLTTQLEKLRQRLQENPEGLEPEALCERNRREVMAHLNREIGQYQEMNFEAYERERWEEGARQDAALLPSPAALDKILRYETKLERQMFRAMAQLERIQRMRRGEAVPAPVAVTVTERN